jgi:acyl-CoA synthetase (AMP-forming)/AMP-acid ligase II/acyl carrier protein
MNEVKHTILDYLFSKAAESPGKTAFVILENGEQAEKNISYGELKSWVERMGTQLGNQGLAGKRVLLAYSDVFDFIISFLACSYAGIIPVPVSDAKGSKYQARLARIIDDVQASAVLCSPAAINFLKESLSEYIRLYDIELIVTDPHAIPDEFSSIKKYPVNEIAFIQYTSGSTEQPKGVVITVGNLLHNQCLIKNTFGCNEQSIIFSWLPFHHDMGLIGNLLHTIYSGCTCVLMSPLHFMQRPLRWLEGISRYKATHSGAPNFAYDLCVNKISPEELQGLDLRTWIVAYNGSEPVWPDTLQRFTSHFKQAGFAAGSFFPCYGLAEATLLVSGYKNDKLPLTIIAGRDTANQRKVLIKEKDGKDTRVFVSSGKIAFGMEVKIISEDTGQECNELEEGEIFIEGDSVTNGFWGRDNSIFFREMDGRKFLQTGDLGFIYKGELFVCGRRKEMLIIRGKNYYPYDIEHVVAACSIAIVSNGVSVFSRSKQDEDVIIVAEIKKDWLKDIGAENIIRAIGKTVTGSFGIHAFDIILTTPMGIPRTTSGKLQRVLCREKYDQNSFTIIASQLTLVERSVRAKKNPALAGEALRLRDYNSIKEFVINIIESMAGRLPGEPVDDKTELTAIGLDSLRAMELINTVNKDLGINIDASKIFRNNTLADLLNAIENMLWLNTRQFSEKGITL